MAVNAGTVVYRAKQREARLDEELDRRHAGHGWKYKLVAWCMETGINIRYHNHTKSRAKWDKGG